MALTARQQLGLRRELSTETAPRWTKAEIGAVFQALEDWWTSAPVRANLSATIDAASGVGLTPAEKRKTMKFWLQSRFGRE